MRTRRNALLGFALVLGLTACAQHHQRMGARTPDPANPQVHVIGGNYLVVDQEPIYVPFKDKNFLITWHLPRDSGYEFPKDGIVIARPEGEFDCRLQEGGKRFSCTFRNSTPDRRYKYTIRVQDKGRVLNPLDPFIVNG